jgi:hypothetical protein
MPDKPTWFRRLDDIVREIEALPFPFIDRTTVEQLLGVGKRRAQQILKPCATRQIGTSLVAEREPFLHHLRSLAAGEAAYYEQRRRHRLAHQLATWHRQWVEQPRVLVEAPARVQEQDWSALPPGVHVQPGRITVDFNAPQEALEKLLALAMAIGNDFVEFERLAAHSPTDGTL